MKFQEWEEFNSGNWTEEINVRDFIQTNYTPYEGDSSFLKEPTEKTKKLWDEVLELYKKEKAIINGYVEEQYIMTSELDQKYTAFLKELEDEANKFFVLVDNAFAPDFRERFLYSISLAKEVGVDENELLMDLEAIDSFFLE